MARFLFPWPFNFIQEHKTWKAPNKRDADDKKLKKCDHHIRNEGIQALGLVISSRYRIELVDVFGKSVFVMSGKEGGQSISDKPPIALSSSSCLLVPPSPLKVTCP